MSKGASHVCVGLCAHCIFVSFQKISSYRLHCTIDQDWLYTCTQLPPWYMYEAYIACNVQLSKLAFTTHLLYHNGIHVFYTCIPNYHSLLECYYNFNISDLVFHMTRWLGVMSHAMLTRRDAYNV